MYACDLQSWLRPCYGQSVIRFGQRLLLTCLQTAVYLSLWYAARKLAGGDDTKTILPIKPRKVILS